MKVKAESINTRNNIVAKNNRSRERNREAGIKCDDKNLRTNEIQDL